MAEFRNTEARITTAPAVDDESVTIRRLSRENVFIPINELGLGENAQRPVDQMLRRNEGITLERVFKLTESLKKGTAPVLGNNQGGSGTHDNESREV